MWLIFTLLIILILGGVFTDLMLKIEKTSELDSKYTRIIHWVLVVIFYFSIIYWVYKW
jgi:hypothetical protein